MSKFVKFMKANKVVKENEELRKNRECSGSIQ